jgi:hypothetical protein
MGGDLNQEGKDMVSQGLLPFKIERTKELITPRAGLAMFDEVLRALDVKRRIEPYVPKPGSNRGYEAWSYIEPLLLMLAGGGRHVEDLREIRDDQALRTAIGLETMPAVGTVGDWLWRAGRKRGMESMRKADEVVAAAILKRLAASDYTLDIDATVIEAEKKEAKWTYKEVLGYQPQLGFLAENGICLSQEFREGNVPAQSGAGRFLKRCLRLCPQIRRLRSDSAFYQAEVINACEENEIGFTITADQTLAVKEVIQTVRDWEPLLDEKGQPTDREVGTAIHVMTKVGEPFRLVIQRWQNPQRELFEENAYCYQVIATNRDDLSPTEVVRFHNDRGQVENLIKELKIGLGMEQMTSGDFRANGVWFALGVLAYNLVQAQKLLFLDPVWRTKTIGTLRWQLLETAGRLVRHGRQLILRLAVSAEKYACFLLMRHRMAALA